MAIDHRKLLHGPSSSNQTTDCSNCTTTCPYDCDYPQFYWPPEPPPSSTIRHDSATTHLSPYLIVIVAVIGSAILFISYYLIMIRYCTRSRQPPATRVDQESQDFVNEDHRQEIDHPIWYIATVGLQPAVVNSIAVVKFKKGDGLIDGTDCSVCLSEFEDDESLRLLPKCNHAFHIRCIDTWLRSHTNCPLCRAAIFSSNSNSVFSEPNDGNRNHGFGLNQVTQRENEDGDLGSNIRVQESGIEENRREIQDSKTENETVITLRRSFSMDSGAEIVSMESKDDELQSSNPMGDSRTSMMMRSFSYSGRSII